MYNFRFQVLFLQYFHFGYLFRHYLFYYLIRYHLFQIEYLLFFVQEKEHLCSIFEEENLLQAAETLGKKLKKRFDAFQKEYEFIGEVRGLGPMLALELVKDRESKEPAADEAKALVKFCHEKGLIILSCGNFGNVIRTLMPLVITDEQLDRDLAILEEGLGSLSK